MSNKIISDKLSKLNKKTLQKRKAMKKQLPDNNCASIINQNFRDLECIVYSTIK
jgi:hypothetical protein